MLVDSEHRARDNRRIKTLLKDAELRIPSACIEDVDPSPGRGIDKAMLRQLASSAWVDQNMNTLITGAQLLILDDIGLSSPTDAQRHDLLEVLEDRYGARATVVTSQLPRESWHAWIGDPTLADAILGRLVHNAYKIDLTLTPKDQPLN